jgi:uridine kinase
MQGLGSVGDIKLIGISGGSGAGKTTLAKALLQHSDGDALMISYDRYYKHVPCGNYDIPESLDTELLLEHLQSLKSGQAVNLPIYDRFINQQTEFFDKVEPNSVVIVEDIFALHHPELLELYDGKIFVETSTDDVRFHRRMIRDIKERGDTEATVAQAWETNVMSMHRVYVEPQRERADIVVSGEADVSQSLKQVLMACALPESVGLMIC